MIDFTRLALRFQANRRHQPQLATEEVVLGATAEGERVHLATPCVERAQHAAVLAASGAGKTIMVAAALVDEYRARLAANALEAESLIVVDPKGDLVSAILAALCAEAPQALSNVVYLNPFSPQAFAFNLNRLPLGNTPLDIRAAQLAQLCATVSTSTGAQRHLGVGARQVDVLTHVLLAILSAEHPAASVVWSLEALATPEGQRQLARLSRSPRAKAFLEHTNLGDELKTSCMARLRASFASCEQLERIVAAPACLDLAELTAAGKIVLIDLGSPPGGLESLVTFWANLLCRLLIDHVLTRPSPWHGHHLRFIVDEAQVVAATLADVAERLLTTGRSRGISLVALSQGTTLIDAAAPTLLRVLLTNTPTKVVGRLAVGDADLLAREQAPKPGSDESLSSVRSRLVGSITNLPDREFFLLQPGGRVRFTSRSVDVGAWTAAAEREHARIQQVMNGCALASPMPPRISLAEAARSSGRSDNNRRGAGDAPRPRSPWG